MKTKLHEFLVKYWHYILLIIFFFALIYQHQFIYLYGDDYFYGIFHNENFWKNHIEHYLYANGRALVHFLVSLILIFDVYLFRIINPVLIVSLLIVIAKLVSKDKEEYKIALSCGIVLFSMLDINITRQSVYWLDGSFNYLLPIFISLLTFLYLKKSIYEKKRYIFLPLLGLIAGMTVEQSALVALGGIFLIILSAKFIMNKKVNKIHILTLLLALIGAATVFFAPGTFNRMQEEKDIVSILYNINQMIHVIFIYKGMYVYHMFMILSMIVWIINYKNKNMINKLIVTFLILIFVVLLKFDGGYYENLPVNTHYLKILGAVGVTILIYLLGGLSISLHTTFKEKDDTIAISLILAVGAQLMMVISPIFDYRILLCSVILLFIPILRTLVIYRKNIYIWIFMTLIISIFMANNLLICISLLVLSFQFINHNLEEIYIWKKLRMVVICGVIFVLVGMSMFKNIKGYIVNSTVQEYNIGKIKEFIKENNYETLTLKKVPIYEYGWSYPYESDYHMKVMKMYYRINENVQVEYK
ncbi:MAG: hypothetical protein A2Y24_07160 [Clostridiales bacterium GWE2_32_10]|nr:MAG: hypothetical protein A2Y24_07160 [Clostridiales bacterium GWE2_32_10]HBY20494.1 hypothetical protein [Clostridiales bacterium]